MLDEFGEESVAPLPEDAYVATSNQRPPRPWKNWGPTLSGDITPCFQGGFLYRIVNPDSHVWALYNDTFVYEMHATLTFCKDAPVEPLNSVETEMTEEDELQVRMVVYPMETLEFLRGARCKFHCHFDGKPLSAGYIKGELERTAPRIAEERAAVERLTTSTDSEKVLAACKEHQVPFVDLAFPPGQDSLDHGSGKVQACPWERPKDYLPVAYHAQVRLFRRSVHPSCAQRGELGNSWVIGAIAALSENPKYVKSLFRHPTNPSETMIEQQLGAYRVLLNKGGWWHDIIVDSYLPVLGHQQRFARSSNDSCEMWVSYLEKAYAKRSGSYASIAGGDPLFAIRDFTGFPTSRLDAAFRNSTLSEEKSAELFARLTCDCENGHLVLLSTPGNSDPRSKSTKYKENGVFVGYAYAVLDIGAVGDFRLVRLRNPWAPASSWKGKWAPSSSWWEEHPDAAALFPSHNGMDGSFVMDWSEVLSFFAGGGVVFNHFDYADYRIRATFSGCVPSVCVEVSVTEPTLLTFILSQPDHRGTPQENAEYSPIMLSLAAVSDREKNEYSFVVNSTADAEHPTKGFTFLQGRDISLMYTFVPQESPYLVIPRRLAQAGEPNELNVVLGILSQLPFTPYGQAQIRLKQLPPTSSVFENYYSFPNDATTTTAVFQVKRSSCGVMECTGSQLNNVS